MAEDKTEDKTAAPVDQSTPAAVEQSQDAGPQDAARQHPGRSLTSDGAVTVSTVSPEKPVSPVSCLLGAIVAAGIAFFFYRAAGVIAGIFAQNQVQSDNFIVMRMSAAVRTLVIGIFALGAGVFGMAALGLGGLGIQTIFQKDSEGTP